MDAITISAAILIAALELSVIALIRRSFRSRPESSTYHKLLAIHIADTTRSAGRYR